MEIARMNYYFTGALVILFVLLCFMEPAHSRNEYLNNGTNTCSTGDLSVSLEQRDSESRYRHFNPENNSNSPHDDKSIRLKSNPNFQLLVSKCSGIIINDENQERPEGSAWDDLRDDYQNLPEHKDKKFMGTKDIMKKNTLKMPPKDFLMPLPKPKVDE